MNKLTPNVIKEVVSTTMKDSEILKEISYTSFVKNVSTTSSSQKRNKAHRQLQSKLDETLSILNHINKLKESSQEDLSMKESIKMNMLTKLKEIYIKIKEL
jgi:hypothetical protein